MASIYTGTISFSGLSSGIDTSEMVTKLVAAERAGADTRISTATSSAQSKISSLGNVSSSLSSLQTALDALASDESGNARTTTVADGAGFTASAASGAAVGSYDIEVVQLATKHKLTTAAYDSDATVGSGTLSISAGDESFDVSISSTATLSDIAKAINTAAAGKGVVASIVSTDDGDRLVLTAADTGEANAITVTSSDSSLAALTYPGTTSTDDDGNTVTTGLTESTAAQDAVIKVDGYTKTSSSNTIDDVLDGVTLTLTQATEGTAYALDIDSDQSSISSAVSTFVSAYNSLLTMLSTVSAFDIEEETQAPLTGDAMVRSLQSQLRNLVGNNIVALNALGITTDKTGAMTLDSSTLAEALEDNPSAASNLFNSTSSSSGTSSTSASNLGTSLAALISSMVDSNKGVITLRTDSLNDKLEDLEDQSAALDERMAKVQARYEAQFTAMETTMAQMQTTSSYLTQMLDSISTSNSSSSSS
ncbi:MAG: flagellar filament capping protein FliD [Pseudomonas sp.]